MRKSFPSLLVRNTGLAVSHEYACSYGELHHRCLNGTSRSIEFTTRWNYRCVSSLSLPRAFSGRVKNRPYASTPLRHPRLSRGASGITNRIALITATETATQDGCIAPLAHQPETPLSPRGPRPALRRVPTVRPPWQQATHRGNRTRDAVPHTTRARLLARVVLCLIAICCPHESR